MNTKEVKKLVKAITGFDYVAVRTGTGSMRGYMNIFSSMNDNCNFKDFESKLRSAFNIEIFSCNTLTIKL